MQVNDIEQDSGLLRDLMLSRPRACRRVEGRIRRIVQFGYASFRPEDVDDIVQNVLLNLYSLVSKPDFRLERSLNALLRRITLARCTDLLRRRRPCINMTDEVASTDPSPLEELEFKDRASRLRFALDNLNPKCRYIIRARFLENISYRDLAVQAERSEATVRGRLRNCLILLRDLVKRLEADLPHSLESTRKLGP